MRPNGASLLTSVFESGPDDRFFDALLFAGPVVIVGIALVGRSLPTLVLAMAYIALFVGYTLYNGVSSEN